MPDPAISWIIIAILLILTCFFSASETAFACCNRYKVQVAADEGKKYAKVLLKILDNYTSALTTVLIGNNILAIAMSSIGATLFIYYFQATTVTDYVASIISSIVITFIVFVFGDTFPKTVARSIPDTLSKYFAYPIYILMIILTPINFLFNGFMKLTDKIFKVKGEEEMTEEEFSDIVEKASEEEMIDEDQAEIVQSTLDFLDTNVKQVFTPKSKMFAIDITDLTNEEINDILIKTDFSRIPIYEKDFDNMIGVLVMRIYLEEYSKDPHVSIRSILQKPYYVTTNVMIDDLFKGFKKHHTHLALVKNNKDIIIGMVTMEDILEEIVSDISEPSIERSKK